jgi:hypothetical protein
MFESWLWALDDLAFSEVLDARMTHLRDFVAASANWHFECHRYGEEDLRQCYRRPVPATTSSWTTGFGRTW